MASTEEFFSTVRTAPSRPQRVYVAAWWFRPDYTEALYVSDDTGDSFSRVDVSRQMPNVEIRDGGMGLARGSFYVYAVDPTDPDTVWAGLQQNEDPRHSFVLESNDQGRTWALRLDTSAQLTGISVSADGQTVWASTSGRLYRSVQGGPFTALEQPKQFSCAWGYGDRFYSCGWPEVDMFAAARFQDGGFVPLLTWPRVTSVVQCPATSPVKQQCEAIFPALVAGFPKPFDADGGTGGGGAGGGTSGSGGGGGGDMPPRGCSCSLSGAEVSLTLLVLVGRFASVHALRRRRVHG